MSNPNALFPIWAPRLLSILRMVVAVNFISHGTQKVFGVPSVTPFPGFPLSSVLGIAGIIEMVFGPFLLLGLFTRPIAFILCGEMAAAYLRTHLPQNVWPLLNGGEITVTYCFLFLYFVAAGGGSWSLDSLRQRGGRPAS